MKSKNEKLASLQATIKNLEKEYGKGVVMRMGDAKSVNVEVIPSGSLGLDEALGIGGFPRGRVIEIYGPESSGKTTVALHAIAEAQKKGDLCAFVDAEHALDVKYAKNIGVDVDNLYISQPSNGEQALEIVDSIINSQSVGLIVVDSVAALVPKAEIDGNMGDPQMALQARLMSQALRKITSSLSRFNTTIIFINQLRMKIGVFFGNPETTTGGNALKFYSSIRIDIRKVETLKKADVMIGSRVKIKVVKNKLAPPFKFAELNIYYGEGFSHVVEILNLAIKHEVVKKSGTWFSYKEERIGQGVDNVKNYLKENPTTFNNIKNEVKAIIFKKDENPDKSSQSLKSETNEKKSSKSEKLVDKESI